MTSLFLHVWGIKKDLPYIPESDEAIYVQRAVNITETGDWNPGWFGNPGSTTIYPLAIIYRAWFALKGSGSLFGASHGIEIQFNNSITGFYLLGRFLSILYAVLSLSFIFLIGEEVFGTEVGLAGAFLFSLYPLAVSHAQLVRTDSAAEFFGVIAIWSCLRVYKKPTYLNQFIAGLSIGLSISSRYFMVTLIPILVVIDGGIYWGNKKFNKHNNPLLLINLGLSSIFITFYLSTPYFFFDFHTAVENILFEARSTHLGADGFSRVGNLIWYLTNSIPQSVTWSQIVFALAGIIEIISKRSFEKTLILGYVVFFLLGISLSALHWARWYIQILPFVALIVAHGVIVLVDRLTIFIKSYGIHRYILFTCIIFILGFIPAYRLVLHDIQQSNPSTRILARKWVVRNLSNNSKIAEENYTAPLDNTGLSVTQYGALGYEGNLDDYIRQGFSYLIVSSYMYERYFKETERYPSEVKFYEDLFYFGKLIKEFKPSYTHGGPIIRIYQLPKHSNFVTYKDKYLYSGVTTQAQILQHNNKIKIKIR